MVYCNTICGFKQEGESMLSACAITHWMCRRFTRCKRIHLCYLKTRLFIRTTFQGIFHVKGPWWWLCASSKTPLDSLRTNLGLSPCCFVRWHGKHSFVWSTSVIFPKLFSVGTETALCVCMCVCMHPSPSRLLENIMSPKESCGPNFKILSPESCSVVKYINARNSDHYFTAFEKGAK